MNIMIDLETLDTAPSAVILSIGLVAFNKEGIKQKLYLVPSIQQQLNKGRTISESTLMWWMGQNSEARKVFTDEKRDFLSTMKDVNGFISGYPRSKIWGYGSNFDPVLVDDAFRSLNLTTPWKYWDVRCLRTFCDENEAPLPKNTGVLHNAIDDATRQAEHMIAVWKKDENQMADPIDVFGNFLVEALVKEKK